MKKQGCVFISLLIAISLLSGCLSNVWTGASLVYDRHNVYKKIDDYRLSADAHRALYHDWVFKQEGCDIDLAIFNGDILLAGHVPTEMLRQQAFMRLTALTGYRRVFNQLSINTTVTDNLLDSWITAKIRSRIFADSNIDPNVFKIITVDQVVFIMGDVRPLQAERVIYIARTTDNVRRVVKLLKYFNLSKQALADT